MKIKLHQKWFTIPELLVGMTIVATLATIGFISYTYNLSKARDAVRSSDIKNISKVVKLHQLDTWKVPSPTGAVNITYSGATVWSQWVFWSWSAAETRKVFGELKDPKHGNQYTYSTTRNKKEYQLAAVFENRNIASELVAFAPNLQLTWQAYASGPFSPLELAPKIWLDGNDIDGDGDTNDNPGNGTNITTWINKSSAGAPNNPSTTVGNIQYTTNGFGNSGGYPWVFVPSSAWLRLNHSSITQGDIFYVVQKNNPFGWYWDIDFDWYGLYSATDESYNIWYRWYDAGALRIWSSPNINKYYDADQPYIFWFHTNNVNYSFRNVGSIVSQWSTNSITWHTWAFNRAWAVVNKNSDLVISEILIFDRALSTAERQKVEWYLAHKWWMTWSLPWGHPYEESPPESSGPPPAPDSEPNAFTLNDVTGASLSTPYSSNTISVWWINMASPISISWWEYKINSWTFTSSAGLVNNGDSVTVRLTSSVNDSTTTQASLNIGGITESFRVTTFVSDITPDNFTFTPITDANLGVTYSSNTVHITGINMAVPVSITGTGAEYKISDGQESDITSSVNISATNSDSGTSASELIDNNQSWGSTWWNNGNLPVTINIDLWLWRKERATKYTFFRRDNGMYWQSESPRNWTFEGSNNNTDWTVLDSRSNEYIYFNSKREFNFSNNVSYRYYRIQITTSNSWSTDYVSLTELEILSEWAGVFRSSPWTLSEGEYISVRMPSASTAQTSKTARLQVWNITRDFIITTVWPDTTPDWFSFQDVSSANLNTSYESNTITINGINTSTPISISGSGSYKINGGSYQTTPSNVENGDIVRIRQTSSSANSQTRSSTLTVWWVSATYNVTTPAPPPDTTPDSFSFTSITDASLNTDYTSNTITISWINTASPLSISWGKYRKNNSGSYTSSSTTVQNGDRITLQGRSSSSASQTVNVTLTAWWVSDTFSITTVPADSSFDDFSFSNVSWADRNTSYSSNIVTITGINVWIPISISGGEYRINGGSWKTNADTVYENDTIEVRRNSSGTWWGAVTATLTIWWINKAFSITTGAGDTQPDQFTFNDELSAGLNTQYTSNAITITGINATTSISVVWGEYRVWNIGTFTSLAGTVENGDTVSVRLVSSIDGETTKSVTLNVWGITDSYDVTTAPYSGEVSDTPTLPESDIYVTGNYNGLIVHTQTGSEHFVLAAPSIIAYDTSIPEYTNIVENKKFVFKWYENIPASYSEAGLTMSGGFDFRIPTPIFYKGTKEDIGSYSGLKQIDEWIRSTYSDFTGYKYIAESLDDYSLWYLEKIIGASIGINPIKPYYCSDILRSKLIHNVAPKATVTASPSIHTNWVAAITNGVKSTQWDLDHEYHSDVGNAFISFEWEKLQRIGYVRIYNRTGCCTNNLWGASIKLYNQNGSLIYSHPLWDTTNDFIIDLDLAGIGQLHYVKKLTIESVWWKPLTLREVEIFLWGELKDGAYKVDKDGLGWQSPYNVYCDMTTDGGGWTRIGENYITNGNFAGQNHVGEHTFTWYNAVSDNVVVARWTQAPPDSLPDAFVLRHNGDANESYRLFFPKIPGEYFAQEIRISAWVRGTSSSIFTNTINYESGSSSTSTPEYDTITTQGNWRHVMARIPLDGLVKDFTWDLGKWIAWPFFVTGLDMEVFYK